MVKIFKNAVFITLDTRKPYAEAIAVNDNKIIAVGTCSEVMNLYRAGDQIIDLEGAFIYPGFTDSHLHLHHYSEFLSKIDCETSSKLECIAKIQQSAITTPYDQWILGHGWNHNTWTDGIWNQTDLEFLATPHPVYLTNKSLHGAWANKKALQLAGINELTPNPTGGIIGRNPQTGALNGLLYESAVNLIEQFLPVPTIQQLESKIQLAQQKLFSYGITSVHDFDRRLSFKALQNLDNEQKLLLRVNKSIPMEDIDHAVQIGLQTNMGNEHLHIGAVKFFMDGALGTQTAAMLQPYETTTDSGMLLLDKEQLLGYGKKVTENRLPMAVHAIGDRANHILIDVLFDLHQYCIQNHLPPLPHRIEHLQCVTQEDLRKMAHTTAIASMQPIHLCSDIPASEKNWGNRSESVYTFRSVLDENIPLIFGSDAPVEVPDPIIGLHAAVNRQDRLGNPPHAWYAKQKLSMLEALKAFAQTPHSITKNAKILGSIQEGCLCDLTILDQNLLTIVPDQVLHTQVIGTIIDGDWVWRR